MRKSELIDGVVELTQDRSGTMRGLVGRWINFVLDDLASRGHLESLKREESTSLIAGDDSSMTLGRDYSLAPDTDKVYKVFVPAWGWPDGKLKKLSDDDFLRNMLLDGAAKTGRPMYYTVFGAFTLRLHPIPSLTYAPTSPTDLEKLHVWKYKDITHLTENDDITELTIKATPMIIKGCYMYAARFDEQGDYATTQREYERAVVDYFFQQANDLDMPRQVAYRDL